MIELLKEQKVEKKKSLSTHIFAQTTSFELLPCRNTLLFVLLLITCSLFFLNFFLRTRQFSPFKFICFFLLVFVFTSSYIYISSSFWRNRQAWNWMWKVKKVSWLLVALPKRLRIVEIIELDKNLKTKWRIFFTSKSFSFKF